jgi:hypothetical protein
VKFCHYVQRENIRKNSIYATKGKPLEKLELRLSIKYQDLKKKTMHNFEKLKNLAKSDGYCSSGLRSSTLLPNDEKFNLIHQIKKCAKIYSF